MTWHTKRQKEIVLIFFLFLFFLFVCFFCLFFLTAAVSFAVYHITGFAIALQILNLPSKRHGFLNTIAFLLFQ